MAPHSSYPTPGLVPAGFKDWKKPFPDYLPREYTADVVCENDRQVKAGGWADPPDVSMEEIAKRPQNSGIEFRGGLPLNPLGRTGICGRGLLGKWGANCAADPIIIRLNGEFWQVLVIVRKDSGQIALPGGMVDDGEDIPTALFREAAEETGTALDVIQKVLDEPGVYIGDVYEGPVDDPRNTDNAWMVTQARLFYIDGFESSNMISTKSDDPDVAGVFWRNIHDISEMYADHLKWVRDAKSKLNDHLSEVVRLAHRAAFSHRDGDPAVFYVPVPERPSRKRKSSEPSILQLGTSTTNKLPAGGQERTMVATMEDCILRITGQAGYFDLQFAMPASFQRLKVKSFNGRFPWGKGKSLLCEANYNYESKVVRVDSHDDPELWFEVALAPGNSSGL